MTDDIDLTWSTPPDLRHAVLTVTKEGRSVASAALTLDAIDQTIKGLAQLRARMAPGDALAPIPAGVTIDAVYNPPWMLTPTPVVADGSALTFRHPGFGLLGFILPQSVIAAIHAGLGRQLSAPPPLTPRD